MNFALETQEQSDFLLVKPDDHVITDQYDRYTHLTAFGDELISFFGILGDVVFRVFDVVLLEKLFGHLAIDAGGGGIDFNFFHNVMY